MDRTHERKKSALFELIGRWENCKKCPLHESRNQIVFPAGNPDADVVVIGIGPGENEDVKGLPFIGQSGDILADYLKEINFDRDDLAVMNIVGCRPTSTGKDKFGKERIENRDPNPSRASGLPTTVGGGVVYHRPSVDRRYGKTSRAGGNREEIGDDG